MSNSKPSIPWFFIILDVIGTIFLVMGLLALAGMDFGHPVLREVAPGFLLVGFLFMLPLVVWAIHMVRARQAERGR